MMPQSPTPDWAIEKIQTIIDDNDDPEIIEAILELLAAVAANQDQDKFKYEAAWAAIDYAYRKTEHCRAACRTYLGIASSLAVTFTLLDLLL